METKRMSNQRSKEQLLEAYEIEKELAAKLRNASSDERLVLYTSLYDELFRRLPDHPQLTHKKSLKKQKIVAENKLKMINHFLKSDTTFLEIGPGDCSFSFAVTRLVKQVYAVDVSETLTKNNDIPDNFQLIISNGSSIPVPVNSIDVAYSNQLMEHLHPDDALEQLKNIFNVLKPGGSYICITPNRLTGPHDISKYFDTIATGFHLKEYTARELKDLFKMIGFRKTCFSIGLRGHYIRVYPFILIMFENLISMIPDKLRRVVLSSTPIKFLLNIQLIGIK